MVTFSRVIPACVSIEKILCVVPHSNPEDHVTCHQGQHPKYMMFEITSFLLSYFELVQTGLFILFLKSFPLHAALELLCGHPGTHLHSKYGHPAVKIGTPCKYEILPLLTMSVGCSYVKIGISCKQWNFGILPVSRLL